MTGRSKRIQEEAAALWRQLHTEPPPEGADGPELLDLIMRNLPTPEYDRLANAHLRPTNIAFPRRG